MNARSHRVKWPGRAGERPGPRDLGQASGLDKIYAPECILPQTGGSSPAGPVLISSACGREIT
jgi:hypothetical protein